MCAVTHIAGALLYTSAPVVADARSAAAVTRAARAHARGGLGALVQIEGRAVYIERPHAAQEASLSGGCSSCGKKEQTSWEIRGHLYITLIDFFTLS